MRRYTLQELYTMAEFNQLGQQIYQDYEAVAMSESSSGLYNNTISFVMSAVYGYFYGDLVAYAGDSKNEVKGKLYHRLGLDISIKLAYWYKKYTQIKKLLTTEDLSLLQTSKMTSSSSDKTKSAGGTLQKTATTPTGVSATGSTDSINIDIKSGTSDGDNDVETNGFADKYSNAQQKFANATRVEGERSGEILREGSIDDLLKVLEKLPSSFATEVQKDLQKHFIFDYDGEFEDLYDFMEGDFSGMIIGKTRTNQPVEKVEGFDTAVNDIIDEQLETDGSINDAIVDLVEGGTLDNAKPLYCHPIMIEGYNADHSKEVHLALFIFNNSETPINTLSALLSTFSAIYTAAGGTAYILLTGGFKWTSGDYNDGYPTIATLIQVASDDNAQIKGVSVNSGGVNYITSWSDLEDLTTLNISDGVNKLN